MKLKVFNIFLIIVAVMIISASMASAINPPGTTYGGEPDPSTIGSIEGLFAILMKELGWVYTIFFVIAAFFILFAAFTYLTAKGDAEKVKGARDQIIYAVIAIVVALLAFSIDKIVASFIQ